MREQNTPEPISFAEFKGRRVRGVRKTVGDMVAPDLTSPPNDRLFLYKPHAMGEPEREEVLAWVFDRVQHQAGRGERLLSDFDGCLTATLSKLALDSAIYLDACLSPMPPNSRDVAYMVLGTRHFRKVFSCAFRCPAAAEHAFDKLYQNLAAREPKIADHIGPWLCRTAMNKATDIARAEQRRRLEELSDDLETGEPTRERQLERQQENRALRVAILDCFARLSDSEKEAFICWCQTTGKHDFSGLEWLGELDCKKPDKDALFRARKKMRACLREKSYPIEEQRTED